ncbi:hypothetical protein H6P81_020981 [Aristolochia fimbriata]|uniref:Uncharacterized protein n=1 Tax=Aristolochia fimbriata TaxID=158543 RepID=A0AAV7DYZ6_ARIFI|nr:hypothetical protein H6P81_020981 [Aristolochia fimbriata]
MLPEVKWMLSARSVETGGVETAGSVDEGVKITITPCLRTHCPRVDGPGACWYCQFNNLVYQTKDQCLQGCKSA